MHRFILFFLLLPLAFACNNNAGAAGEDNQGTAGQSPPAAEVSYPSLPFDTLQMLWERCDYIDYLFYNQNFSVSQSEQAAIQNALSHISDEVPTINPDCQPTGHLFYQVNGENRLEADLYFQQECVYFVFYEDGKPAYANKLTTAGFQFYQTLFSRMREGNPGN